MAVLGELTDVAVDFSFDGISAYAPNSFPTPATAWGYLGDVDFGLTIDGIFGLRTGALTPEGSYLEPTTGQIWPR